MFDLGIRVGTVLILAYLEREGFLISEQFFQNFGGRGVCMGFYRIKFLL